MYWNSYKTYYVYLSIILTLKWFKWNRFINGYLLKCHFSHLKWKWWIRHRTFEILLWNVTMGNIFILSTFFSDQLFLTTLKKLLEMWERYHPSQKTECQLQLQSTTYSMTTQCEAKKMFPSCTPCHCNFKTWRVSSWDLRLGNPSCESSKVA